MELEDNHLKRAMAITAIMLSTISELNPPELFEAGLEVVLLAGFVFAVPNTARQNF